MSRRDDEENSTMIRRPANYRKEALKRKFVNIDCFISFCLDCPGKEVDLGGNLVALSPSLALTITYSWTQERGLSLQKNLIKYQYGASSRYPMFCRLFFNKIGFFVG